jgi:hypothetical protein
VDNTSPVSKSMEWMSLLWHKQADLLESTLFQGRDLLSWNSLPIDTVPLLVRGILTVGGHSMSDPGTTYRTREEIQNMRSSNDAIQGLKSKLLEWGVVSENELKEIDKNARKKVDDEVAEAEKSPERTIPFMTSTNLFSAEGTPKNLFEDIYVPGSEPASMRGRILEENYSYDSHKSCN